MFHIVPIAISVASFSVAAWAVNKVVAKVTGQDIEGNLDTAYDKVVEFVRPAETPPTDTDNASV